MRMRLVAWLAMVGLVLGCLPAATALAAGLQLQVNVTGVAGAPLSGARVELIAPGVGTVAAAGTDASGRASLHITAPAAVYWLRVWGTGYSTVDRPWVPAADGPGLTVEMTPLTGTLTGLVSDHLGVPVAGARISAWRTGFGLAAEAETGPEGIYTLRGLPAPGPYQIQVTARGYRPYAALAVSITAGEEKRSDLTLQPAQATVAGEVANVRTGAGLAGARVELLRKGWGILAAATTAADGSFALSAPAVDSPDYQVRVWAADHFLAVSDPFALAPGARKDFTGTDRLTVRPVRGSIWGRLSNDTGEPMADVPVELQLQGVGTVARTRTDSTGFFTFDQVDAGTYRVRTYPGTYIGSGWAPSDSAWVAVNQGGSRYVEITGLRYERKFYSTGAVAGTVTDPAGQPLAGARVTLSRGDDPAAFTAVTDAEGRYHVGNVDANRPKDARPAGMGYVIQVEAEGFWPSDQPAQGTATAAFVDVTQGHVTQADFTLRPRNGAVVGLVQDDQRRPLGRARVTLYREGSGVVAEMEAAADGDFRFDRLPAPLQGGYVVVAERAGYFPGSVTTAQDIAAAPGSTARVTLRLQPAAARLHGRVADSRGLPVPAATVKVLNAADGRTWETTADANGWYALDRLPAGPGDSLLVRTGTGAEETATAAEGALTLAGVRARTVNLAPARTGDVGGVVYGPDGAVAAGVVVELWHEGAVQATDRSRTQADGSYRFSNLVPGDRYTVVAGGPGVIPSGLAPGEATVTSLLRVLSGQEVRADRRLSNAPAAEQAP